eukprot:m.440162 g.440162  ORF g.440162 m.440162 type:complete len:708 (+) comp18473_c0_seq1:177-2300(+)
MVLPSTTVLVGVVALVTPTLATPYFSCHNFNTGIWSVVCDETGISDVPPRACTPAPGDFCQHLGGQHYLFNPTNGYYSYRTGATTPAFTRFNYVAQLPLDATAQAQCQAKANELNQLCDVSGDRAAAFPQCSVFGGDYFPDCVPGATGLDACLAEFSAFDIPEVQPHVEPGSLQCFGPGAPHVIGVPNTATSAGFDRAIGFGTAASNSFHDPLWVQVPAGTQQTKCNEFQNKLADFCFAPLCSLVTYTGSAANFRCVPEVGANQRLFFNDNTFLWNAGLAVNGDNGNLLGGGYVYTESTLLGSSCPNTGGFKGSFSADVEVIVACIGSNVATSNGFTPLASNVAGPSSAMLNFFRTVVPANTDVTICCDSGSTSGIFAAKSAATLSPTQSPTASPTTSAPTANPTTSPTTSAPTMEPTLSPTTSAPTMEPTVSPTTSPSLSPSMSPTFSPTFSPTVSPTASPTTPCSVFTQSFTVNEDPSVCNSAPTAGPSPKKGMKCGKKGKGDNTFEDVFSALWENTLAAAGIFNGVEHELDDIVDDIEISSTFTEPNGPWVHSVEIFYKPESPLVESEFGAAAATLVSAAATQLTTCGCTSTFDVVDTSRAYDIAPSSLSPKSPKCKGAFKTPGGKKSEKSEAEAASRNLSTREAVLGTGAVAGSGAGSASATVAIAATATIVSLIAILAVVRQRRAAHSPTIPEGSGAQHSIV